MDKDKMFNLIQEDIGKIEQQLNNRNGSQELWNDLQVRYSMILSDLVKHVKVGGKIAAVGQEFDYRPELKKLKTALLTWIMMNEDKLELSKENIDNEAKDLLNEVPQESIESELRSLIMESKLYILKKDFTEKKIGIDKIWDAFERLKTMKSSDKKNSIERIIDEISGGDEELKFQIDEEFRLLTKIGNTYSIRHHEIDQKKFPNNEYIEYFYFSMLALISFVLNMLNMEE
ncbi:hypothetical protein [Clostridium algidicarnis]|uniref:hypothetical protein n=1 Tax=Clostridium algidicarnis TaxID=37659 RepID=UPI0004981785|nr:hypothetical protein [Clostridium algidicarnis]